MSKAEWLRRWQLRCRNIIRAAESRQRKSVYQEVIAEGVRRIMDERGGGAPRHGHRPPGVVALDDDVIVGGDEGRGRWRLLNFRYGLTATADGDRADIDAIGANMCYDYLVMANWPGTEGQEFTKFDQAGSFRIYSTVDAAVDHGIANMGRDFSILVCPGTYNEAVSIGAFAGESIHIYGMGQDVVTIGGSNGHMTLGSSPSLYLHNLTLNGASKSFEGTSSACILQAFNVKFGKPVDARWSGASFWNCDWPAGSHMTPGAGAQSVRIYGGLMEGANLDFTGATGTCDDWRVYGLDMQGTASLKLKHVTGSYFNLNFTQQMNDQVYFDTNNMGVDIDCSFAPPSNQGQAVRVINGATAKSIHLKGNFKNTATVVHADSRFIEVEGQADDWHIDAIFQEDGVGDTIEANGGKSVSGVFTGSKFTLVPTTAEVNTTAGSSGNVVDSGVLTGGSVGTVPPGWNVGADTELTISGGVITATQTHHTIDTEETGVGDGDPTDDLDTINGLVANQFYFFYPAHTDRTVVFKHGTGNLCCIGNQDITLDDSHDFVWGFSPDGTNLYVEGVHGHSGGAGGVHNLLDGADHPDTLAGNVVAGDVPIGNDTPLWSRLGIVVPGANIINALGIANGETTPTWKSLFDATNPAAAGPVAAPGTSLLAAHRDHVHALGTLGATWVPGAQIIGNYDWTGRPLGLAIGDGAFGFSLVAGNPFIVFDTAGGENDYLTYDRVANLWTFAKNGVAAVSMNATGLLADVIAELTGAAGVTIDGVLLKDSDITIPTDNYVYFRDAQLYLRSSADGQLDLAADTEIELTAPTVDVQGNITVTGTVDGVDIAARDHAQVHGIADHTEHANWKAFHSDGAGDEQEVALGAAGTIFAGQGVGVAAAPAFDTMSGDASIAAGGAVTVLSANGAFAVGGDIDMNGNNLDEGGVIFLIEQAAADADVAGQGQFWVKTATPNEPMFTDDAGTDIALAVLKQSIQIRARSWEPNTTNPAADAVQTEATNGKNYTTRSFAVNEQASIEHALPPNYDGGTVTWWYYWIAPTGCTAGDTVIFGLRGGSSQDGDAIDEAQGGQITVTDTVLAGGAGTYHESDESAALTIGGTPQPGDMVVWEVERTGGDMAEEPGLWLVYIRYGVTQPSNV